MKLNSSFVLEAPREDVWEIFMDAEKLAGCLPGCENINALSETEYEADMVVKVQFMTIKFKANGSIKNPEPYEKFDVEMTGIPIALAGQFRNQMVVELVSLSETSTEVKYQMDMQMSGRLASLGEIIMKSTVTKNANEFAKNAQLLFM